MSGGINSDARTWIDAALSAHLRDGRPLEDVKRQFVGVLLAQLLLYYRYDVPEKWHYVAAGADVLGLGKRLADGFVGAHSFAQTRLTLPDDEKIYDALEVDTWDCYCSLPSSVWSAIQGMSGFGCEDWESLPGQAGEALKKVMVCPRCGRAAVLEEFGEVTEYADPFEFSGGTRINLRCGRCGEKVTFVPESAQIEKTKKNWLDARHLIIWTGVVSLILILIGLLRDVR